MLFEKGSARFTVARFTVAASHRDKQSSPLTHADHLKSPFCFTCSRFWTAGGRAKREPAETRGDLQRPPPGVSLNRTGVRGTQLTCCSIKLIFPTKNKQRRLKRESKMPPSPSHSLSRAESPVHVKSIFNQKANFH